MALRYIETRIHLPPEPPSRDVVRELLQRIFEEYRWFQPVRFGRFVADGRLDPQRIDYDALMASYAKTQSTTVLARTDRDFISLFPTRPDAPPHIGTLTWCTSVTEAKKSGWRQAHLHQVVEVMRLLGSPLAQAGLAEDMNRKNDRIVPSPDGIGSEQVFTVRNPSEGLVGLLWRNFFGPPFVRMFGERLAALPPDTRQEFEDGIVLVQPYELPTQAMTPEGDAAEQHLISLLGPECFYDHVRHVKPSRVPQLAALM